MSKVEAPWTHPAFTEADQANARAEGWHVVIVPLRIRKGGDLVGLPGTPAVPQIRPIDAGPFEHAEAAIAFVEHRVKAQFGDELHKRALTIHRLWAAFGPLLAK